MADTPPSRTIHDLDLPTLSSALNLEFVQVRLARDLQWPGRRKRALTLRSVRMLAHDPGRRCVIEYVVDLREVDGTTETVVLVGHLRARRFGTLYQLLRSLWTAGFRDDSSDGISIPEPVGLVADLRISVQKKVDGRLALDAVLDGEPGIAHRVAEVSHKLNAAGIVAERRHTRYDELRALERCLAMVAAREPALAPQLSLLVYRCESLFEWLPPATWCPALRDVHGDKILVAGGRLFLVDFCRYCEAECGFDVGNFMGHLAAHAFRTRGDAAAFRVAEQSLEERFVDLAGEGVRLVVRAYAELAFARHIHLCTQFGAPPHMPSALLTIANRRVEALLAMVRGQA